MPRKFYRQVFEIVVLSEQPLDGDISIRALAYECREGDCSGEMTMKDQKTIDGPTMAKALLEQGSDPEFFQLNEDGTDIPDDGDEDDEKDENV